MFRVNLESLEEFHSLLCDMGFSGFWVRRKKKEKLQFETVLDPEEEKKGSSVAIDKLERKSRCAFSGKCVCYCFLLYACCDHCDCCCTGSGLGVVL